ncbi:MULTISPECIES: Co2+/Mg2+ efflux protein ApaG [Bombella]|uniref:Protein ApaG n=1 Tax=Bombella pollinis TaxID=2967337 RepID=A0ABT3WPB5_9PROT|nr:MULTISPECIES: Co2+/Mg2+ efflux protein ApaG [Bombella]MCX5619577.1 Co2+/Mg2+ efflux protein ApaG [Bombella pollinis]
MSDTSSPTDASLADTDTVELEPITSLPAFTARTGDVTVNVRPFWVDEHSDPDEHRYVWLYHVLIENNGQESIQLLSRSWTITDERGSQEQVHGEGVVGEQPIIAAKNSYQYTSGAELKTPSGFMEGIYHMIAPTSGHRFDVTVPAFSLDSPHHIGMTH